MKTHFLILFSSLLILSGCIYTDGKIESVLDHADALMAEQPDSAYILLDAIDGSELRKGSELQARYALLFTKAQFKTYQDPTSDSLINTAAHYYEAHGSETEKFYAYLYQGLIRHLLNDDEAAATSLLRAETNSSLVTDYYSKGQMYGNLSIVNMTYSCTDALGYARKAYLEFSRGNLDEYAADSKLLEANYFFQFQEMDSCRRLIDEVIVEALQIESDYLLCEAYSQKVQLAISIDSLDIAMDLLNYLRNDSNYTMKIKDEASLITLKSITGDSLNTSQEATALLSRCKNLSDSVYFYVNSYWINKVTNHRELAYKYQDTLLHISERIISSGFRHTSLAAQKDYINWKYEIAEENIQRKTLWIARLLLLIATICFLFVTRYHKKQLEIKLLKKTIEKLELEKNKYAEEYEANFQSLKTDAFITKIHETLQQFKGLSNADLEQLSLLFTQKLPHFENSLRELTSLNETEWQICMLLKLNFSPGEISQLLNKSAGAISSARIRMYSRVFKKKGRTTDWDAFINSI